MPNQILDIPSPDDWSDLCDENIDRLEDWINDPYESGVAVDAFLHMTMGQ